jgi:hypothetical protein
MFIGFYFENSAKLFQKFEFYNLSNRWRMFDICFLWSLFVVFYSYSTVQYPANHVSLRAYVMLLGRILFFLPNN